MEGVKSTGNIIYAQDNLIQAQQFISICCTLDSTKKYHSLDTDKWFNAYPFFKIDFFWHCKGFSGEKKANFSCVVMSVIFVPRPTQDTARHLTLYGQMGHIWHVSIKRYLVNLFRNFLKKITSLDLSHLVGVVLSWKP